MAKIQPIKDGMYPQKVVFFSQMRVGSWKKQKKANSALYSGGLKTYSYLHRYNLAFSNFAAVFYGDGVRLYPPVG